MKWLRMVERKSKEARAAHARRDATIVRAVQEGHTLSEVAKASGLSKSRVHQIVAGATVIVTLTIAASAAASPGLNTIASSIAGRPVTVRCAPLPPGWGGSTTSGTATYTTLTPQWCNTIQALRPGTADLYSTVALFVLVHESVHLQGGARWNDEPRVQCRALRAMPSVAAWLGVRLPHGSLRWIWSHSPAMYRAGWCAGFTSS